MRRSLLLLALLTTGCVVGPDYKPPEVTVSPAFTPTTRTASAAPPQVEWWRMFHDAQLDGLIDRVARNNLDLQRSAARIREVREARAIQSGGYLPTLSVTGSYTHSRVSENGVASAIGGGGQSATGPTPGANGSPAIPGGQLSEFNLYQAGFDASWEPDLFGRVRRGVEAAEADLAAAREDQRDILVTLLAETARDYVELRSLQRRLDIARNNLASQNRTVGLTQERYKQGLTSKLDVSRAQALAATTASSIPALETAVAQSIHRLSVLTGQGPTALVDELSVTAPLPPVADVVPVGLPSDLLRRRPDLRRAERQLAAATARIGVATANLYPRFSLTGSLGLQALEPGDLLSYGSRFYSFGPQISIPIFQGGILRAQVRLTQAREQQAALAFRQTLLNALRDVEDALIAYNKSHDRVVSLQEAVAGNSDAVTIAQDLYSRGLGDFLSVLDAQRNLFTAQDALAQGEADIDANLIALYKALGGGWELTQPEEQPATALAK